MRYVFQIVEHIPQRWSKNQYIWDTKKFRKIPSFGEKPHYRDHLGVQNSPKNDQKRWNTYLKAGSGICCVRSKDSIFKIESLSKIWCFSRIAHKINFSKIDFLSILYRFYIDFLSILYRFFIDFIFGTQTLFGAF